jgi:hypothetical protein
VGDGCLCNPLSSHIASLDFSLGIAGDLQCDLRRDRQADSLAAPQEARSEPYVAGTRPARQTSGGDSIDKRGRPNCRTQATATPTDSAPRGRPDNQPPGLRRPGS